MRSASGILLAVVTAAAPALAEIRPPAVAGAFYTDDPAALRRQVERLLEDAGAADGTARAVVAPHAGYAYSGATAAQAFAGIAKADPKRVVLLGPSHSRGFAGGALPAATIEAFATPLGRVELDLPALEGLRGIEVFSGPAAAHEPEHSLEVELPFLQVVAPRAKIVPVLVGFDTDRETARRMARALSRLLDEHTVVVASSDFTHHGARYGYAPFDGRKDLPEALLEVGRATAGRLAAIDADGFWSQVEVSGDTVCGRRPLAVLMELLAHAFEGRGEVVGLTTSGHVSGSFELSVTYASVVFRGSWRSWSAAAPPPLAGELDESRRRRLLALARATLQTHLAHDQSLARWFAAEPRDESLTSLAGAFVTVHNSGTRAQQHGRLRACMGVIEARQPLLDAVISAAVSAAHDPRFPPLELSELDQVELEVSVLSPSTRVASPEQIEVGTHGVVLSKRGRRAVYLPQVAPEQGWDREEMLEHLSAKAGLPGDAWRRGAELEVFTAQVFGEGS